MVSDSVNRRARPFLILRAFELGNPFYAKYPGDGDCYHKELPTGEIYLVSVKIIMDENGYPIRIEDTLIE